MGCPISRNSPEAEGVGLCSVVRLMTEQAVDNKGFSSQHVGSIRGIPVLSDVSVRSPGQTPSIIQLQTADDEIAIVGIGCRTPGADDQWEFWRLLENKECHVGDIPSHRWNAKAYYAPMDGDGNNVKGKAYVQKGGFLKDVRSFDNLLYQISDYEAAQLDPQQSILLECTTMALEDAGITRRDLAGSRTGVYVGAMHHDYASTFVGQVSTGDQYTASGITNTILASRLSYVFDLRGPCMVLDTACSVSLVAIHQGCLGIRSGDCDMAICGGVNCMLTPHIFMLLCEARMISPTGQCHAFSKDADGYARAEGCGVLILKRLKDALRDGDKIYATVYTGTNQDGRTVTPMLQPSGQQQLKLLQDVYSKHSIDVNEIQYFEAHGTGTPVGDPVEANALGTFLKGKGHKGTVYMGSVKTNIGHTEAAAGILGVIKILLMMKYNKIVPSLHCDEINPKINLTQLGLSIPKETIPWDSPSKLAGCNSFGFGGSNAHAVIKSRMWKESCSFAQKSKMKSNLVCFSGNTEKSLNGSMQQFIEDPQVSTLNLSDVSYTSTNHRDHYSFRAAFVEKDMADLLLAIREKLNVNQRLPCGPKPRIVFVFCGMGTAWDGMCREMLEEIPAFRDAVTEVDTLLKSHAQWSLIQRLHSENTCNDSILSPIAIFACQVGLVAMWRKMGIKPDCVLGQSIGEIAAAYTAGCISLADAVSIIYHRSKLLSELSGQGQMIVVKNVDVGKVHQVIDNGVENGASIALEYSPRACAVSADSKTMERIKPVILSKLMISNSQIKLIPLDVTVPYHSHHVKSASDKLVTKIKQIKSSKPFLPFVSTVSGTIYTKQLNAEYWGDNIIKPVLFHQAIAASVAIDESDKIVFLEIGPKPVTQSHMADLFPHKTYMALPSVLCHSEIKCCLKTAGILFENGIDFNWKNVPTYGQQLTDIPRYCFDRADKRTKTETEFSTCGGYDTLGKRHLFVFAVLGEMLNYRMLISPHTIRSIREHMVMGRNVVPGAVYAECGFALARYMGMSQCAVSVSFHQILVLENDEVTEVEICPQNHVASKEDNYRLFNVNRKGKLHATITLSAYDGFKRERVNLKWLNEKLTQKASKDKICSLLKKLGFEHGPAFSLLEEGVSDFKEECLATMKLHNINKSEMEATVMHPCIIDCMLQSTVLLSAESLIGSKRALPKSFGHLVVLERFEDTMYVHAKLKSKGPKQLIFNLKLLSSNGCVIAELSDFVVSVFSSNQEDVENPFTDMLCYKWSVIKQLKPESNGTPGKKIKTLVICEEDIETKDDVKLIRVDVSEDITIFEKHFRDHCLLTSSFDSLVLFIPQCSIEEMSTETIHSKLLYMSLLIQCVFSVLNEKDFHSRISVILLTVNAFQSVSGNYTGHVNPMATALWGLLRVALYEQVYSSFRAVELQLSDVSFSSNNMALLQWLLCLLSEDELANFSEVLVTKDAVFINQVAQDEFTAEIPSERLNTCGDLHLRENVLFVSNSLADLSQVKAVTVDPCKINDKQKLSLEVESFAQPLHLPFQATMSARYFLQAKADPGDYMVTALEVCGYSKDNSRHKLASCCPLAVGPEVAVLGETTIDSSFIPNYQIGDISKLVLLWSLTNKLPQNQKCSILSSKETLSLAKVLQMLHKSVHLESSSNIEIVLIEELHKKPSLNPHLLSLVLMDCDLMTEILEGWVNALTFISCPSLLNFDVQAFMAYKLPNTEIDLLQTQPIFQIPNLRKVIPQIFKLSQENNVFMKEIAAFLHETTAIRGDSDVRALLQFRSFRLSDISVQLTENTLFLMKGIYIVVGGLTGLGWLCVKFLAENKAGYIAIVNRRSASDEKRANMKDVSHHNRCQIKSFEADITNVSSLKHAMDEIQSWASDGEIRGVFMGAAVVHDSAFLLMNSHVFEEVLSPKVKGAWNLHQLTRHLSLDYFVMHSSVASVLGSPGQANYATGNAFLDGLAFYRRHMGLAAQTINWGPLDTGLLSDKDQIKESMENMGFHLASSKEITSTLRFVLFLNNVQSIPVTINKEIFSQHINRNAPLSLKKRLQRLANVSLHIDDNEDNEDQDFSTLMSLGPAQRKSKFEHVLSKLVARVLGVDSSMVTNSADLTALGLNSVTAMTLISKIERSTKYRLAAVDFLSHKVSVASLANALAKRVQNSTLVS